MIRKIFDGNSCKDINIQGFPVTWGGFSPGNVPHPSSSQIEYIVLMQSLCQMTLVIFPTPSSFPEKLTSALDPKGTSQKMTGKKE